MIVTVSCNGILIEVGFKGFFKRVIKKAKLLILMMFCGVL